MDRSIAAFGLCSFRRVKEEEEEVECVFARPVVLHFHLGRESRGLLEFFGGSFLLFCCAGRERPGSGNGVFIGAGKFSSVYFRVELVVEGSGEEIKVWGADKRRSHSKLKFRYRILGISMSKFRIGYFRFVTETGTIKFGEALAPRTLFISKLLGN